MSIQSTRSRPLLVSLSLLSAVLSVSAVCSAQSSEIEPAAEASGAAASAQNTDAEAQPSQPDKTESQEAPPNESAEPPADPAPDSNADGAAVGAAQNSSPGSTAAVETGSTAPAATGSVTAGDAPSEKGAAPAKEQPKQPAQRSVDLPWTYHQKHLDVSAGVVFNRTAQVGLVPFLQAPFMVEGFGRAGGVVYQSGRFSMAALAEMGGSKGSSSARSLDSSVSFLHMSAGVEPRYHLHPRVFLYGRVMVGPEHTWAQISGYDAALTLSGQAWGFRADGNLGASVRVVGSDDGRERAPRLWVFLEGGYRLSTNYDLVLTPDEDDGPARPQGLDIAPYSPRGIRGSVGLMASF